jgi:RNase P subunit RPR2
MTINPKAVLAAAIVLLAGTLPTTGLALEQLDAPETVTIDAISKLYGPVEFKRHSQLARCKDCHHHTTGQQDMDPNCIRCHANSPEKMVVSCKDCHTKKMFYPEQVTATDNPNLYHIDKPGIKGAYHLNCIPCHVKKNAPSGCEGCHAMTDAGKKMFRTDVKGKAEGAKHHE